MLAGIRLISLDLDDTLWACTPVILRAEQLLYDWLKRRYPRITARHSQMAMRERRMLLMRERSDLRHDLTELRLHSLRLHAREAGYPDDLAEEAFAVFIEARNQVELFEDVLPVLQCLGRRYRLAAVTNGNADIRRIGIDHLFHHAVSSAEVGASKPAPDMFEQVRREAGVSSEEMVHVGDDPVSDIQGAHNAGIASVWINRDGREWNRAVAPAAHAITHLGQLLDLLPDRQVER